MKVLNYSEMQHFALNIFNGIDLCQSFEKLESFDETIKLFKELILEQPSECWHVLERYYSQMLMQQENQSLKIRRQMSYDLELETEDLLSMLEPLNISLPKNQKQ